MSFKSKELGQKGEEIACGFLESNGYCILERNWFCPLGEVDIIAKDDNTIVFVEIKTKSGLGYGSPEEMVGKRKQNKIIHLAEYYLKEKNLEEVSFRVDVVAVILEGEKLSLKLIKNVIER